VDRNCNQVTPVILQKTREEKSTYNLLTNGVDLFKPFRLWTANTVLYRLPWCTQHSDNHVDDDDDDDGNNDDGDDDDDNNKLRGKDRFLKN
jgi:hypothetical protein